MMVQFKTAPEGRFFMMRFAGFQASANASDILRNQLD